jgi:protein-tyrosine-phosphatase
MLSEMVELTMDIPDPIGGELVDYEETAHLLERMLSDSLERISQQALMNQKKL